MAVTNGSFLNPVSVWEVKFHPTSPDHLFSCSEDGSVWHWDATSVAQSIAGTGRSQIFRYWLCL